ncbi:outer membrane lipoprotein-sorting protein [Inmirania thermothiophila]|uniref:Outer membrane lipoprotein-sorting protein n=1 Tax=Inmirania thermothiophila TaxID=1750597 RepID=A0A3N1YAS7_9GAMM|nr:outer membrane lipoprotein-sorting protein [Inmirania thermothiophila]ROR34732.1 outer membrane lipoprotein-sorting protein [Inmirania thermothiophila]
MTGFTRRPRGLLPVLAAVLLAAAAAGADEAGEALARRVYERPDGRDATALARMILQDPGGGVRERRFVSYRRDQGGGTVWSLIRFLAPPDIADTGLLTRDRPGPDSEQWLYLPALGRVRRIAGSRKGGRFVGSDIYYEDLQDREPELDVHRILGAGTVSGQPCTRLESVPREAGSSVYERRIACIHEPTLVALEVAFHQRGRVVKRLTVHRIEKVQGYWTVMDSTMEELASGHRTRIVIERIRYDRGLPESLFERGVLEDPARERRWRP